MGMRQTLHLRRGEATFNQCRQGLPNERTCVNRSACSRRSSCCTSAMPPSATPKRSHSVATPASATQEYVSRLPLVSRPLATSAWKAESQNWQPACTLSWRDLRLGVRRREAREAAGHGKTSVTVSMHGEKDAAAPMCPASRGVPEKQVK